MTEIPDRLSAEQEQTIRWTLSSDDSDGLYLEEGRELLAELDAVRAELEQAYAEGERVAERLEIRRGELAQAREDAKGWQAEWTKMKNAYAERQRFIEHQGKSWRAELDDAEAALAQAREDRDRFQEALQIIQLNRHPEPWRIASRALSPEMFDDTAIGERGERGLTYVEGRDFDKATEDHLTEASNKRADRMEQLNDDRESTQ